MDGDPLEICTLCLDSEVESRHLHVLSTAQADAESSVTVQGSAADWCVFRRTSQGGVVIIPNGWWHWLDEVIVLCFLFFVFFFNSSTVVSTCAQYLYQKTGLMSCSLPVLGGMKFCLFLSAVT